MNQLVKKFITVNLALLVLLASTGFAVYEHVCHFTGKIQVTADIPKDCCPESKQSTDGVAFKKAACCDTHIKVFQLDVVSQVSLDKVTLEPSLVWILPTFPSFVGWIHAFADISLLSEHWLKKSPSVLSLPLFLQLSNLRL